MSQPAVGSIGRFPRSDRRRDVFVSHASEDVDVARKLCDSLETSGWSVFLAARDLPGALESADWSQRIDEALDGCGVLVLLASPEALSKRWVTYEWRSFHDDILADKGGWLVPVCVRGLAPDQLGRALRRYQIVDLRTEREWEAGFLNLLSLVEGYLKRPIARASASTTGTVLTIQGSAVRTAIAASILERLEAEVTQAGGGTLADHFDLIVGDSLGGALAALLAQGARVGESMSGLFEALRPALRRQVLFPLSASRFSSRKLVEHLRVLFGDARLSSVPKCAISTFDLTGGEHRLWSAHPALGGRGEGPLLADLVAATIAAPIYFDPVEVEGSDQARYLLVDGGIAEADPSRVGLEAIRRLFSPSPLLSDILLLSVSSGSLPNPTLKDDSVNMLTWVSHLPNVLMTANRRLVHEHVERQFRDGGALENYLRFDPALPAASQWPMDNLDEAPRFTAFGAEWAESRSQQLRHAARLLVSRRRHSSDSSTQPAG